MPYAMLRGVQRKLGDTNTSAAETVMMRSVEERVDHWPEMGTFYTDEKSGPGKTAESRATEAVLNAVILASYDAGRGHLRPITRAAFNEAWALQEETGDNAGAWKWQNFHLGPWEGDESAYQGAALLMLQALNAPDNYAKEPATRKHLDRLRDYLRKQYAAQPVVNQLYVLWAAAKEPDLLTATERGTLLDTVRGQQQSDGGWRTMAMDERERIDHSPEPMDSDGYATGLAVLVMEETGTPRGDKTLVHGLDWLTAHQEKDGAWNAVSINKQRDPASEPGPFMKDAATAYAVLALEDRK